PALVGSTFSWTSTWSRARVAEPAARQRSGVGVAVTRRGVATRRRSPRVPPAPPPPPARGGHTPTRRALLPRRCRPRCSTPGRRLSHTRRAEEEAARDRLPHEAALLRQLLRAGGCLRRGRGAAAVGGAAADVVRPPPPLTAPTWTYVQFKKVSGGARADCRLVRGLVCTKNVSHRAMPRRIAHPRILCVGCAVAFQRVARLAALRPSLVLVARGVARPAQELLLAAGVALALNVKASVLA
ncbi:T-complex protein 1 subunit gamma, partial [Gryllus bimaculatus]